MKLSLQQIKSIALGAEQAVMVEQGVILYRFNSEEMEYYKNRSAEGLLRAKSTSNVILSFKTNSKSLGLEIKVISGSSRSYFSLDFYVNGRSLGYIDNLPEEFDHDHYAGLNLKLGDFEKTFQLGDGEKQVEIYMPFSNNAIIKSFTLDDGATITPIKRDKKVLIYGDSITQGYDSLRPFDHYAVRLCNLLNAEGFNKGIGGEIFCPDLLRCADSFTPDLITVAYGTNDWSRLGKDVFVAHCKEFFDLLAAKYPDKPIFAITPIWRKDIDTLRAMGEFSVVEQTIRECTAPYKNIVVISGLDLVPHDAQCYADVGCIHPNSRGNHHYFTNLSAQIKKYI